MSAAPRFRLVLVVEDQGARVFAQIEKKWESWDTTLSLSKPIPQEIVDQFSGESVLILVSDVHNGHLQITVPNKKKHLETAALTQLLEEEYDIDTSAYFLDWRNFALSRDQMQVSVSGVEKEIVSRAQDWIAPLHPKKIWAMPFAWFVSVLKSIDPAFIAVENDGFLFLSHHYLGVDDARVLKPDEVEKYIAARQKERKETHLLYVQAAEKTVAALEKKLAKSEVTLQTLIPDTKLEPLQAVVATVLERAQGTLNELLYFELDVPEEEAPEETAAIVPGVAAEAEDESTEDIEDTEDEGVEAEGDTEDEDQDEEADSTDTVTDSENDSDSDSDSELDLGAEDVADVPAGLQPPVPPLQPPAPPVPLATVSPRSKAMVEIIEDDEDEAISVPEAKSEAQLETKSLEKTQPAQSIIPEEKPAKAEIPAAHTHSADPEPDKEPEAAEPEQDVFTQLKGSVGGVQSNNVERYAPVEAKRSWKGPIIVFFVVVILTAVVGGAIFWSQQGSQLLGALPGTTATPTPVPTPSVEPDPAATASATPTPDQQQSVDKAELTVLVVNATGVNGLAGRISEELGVAGWRQVQAGNATGSYTSGATYVSQDLEPAVLAALETDLDRTLTPTTIEETRASQFDIVIVLAEE